MNLPKSKTRTLLFLSLLICFCFIPFVVTAQNQPDSLKKPQPEALKIFIDTPDYYLDFDFIRTEITFVNYVRDRTDADVHILITTQRTGGGGREFTLAFIGLKKFEGNNNTLKHISRQTDTNDDIRRGLVKILKLGLMQYAAHTSVAEGLEVSYKKPEQKEAAPQAVKDPWNYWSFRASLQGYFNGEKSYKYNYLSGSFSANRVTEEWKIKLSLYGSYNQSEYDYYTSIGLSYTFGSIYNNIVNPRFGGS